MCNQPSSNLSDAPSLNVHLFSFHILTRLREPQQSPCTASERRYEFFLSLPPLLGFGLKGEGCQFLSFFFSSANQCRFSHQSLAYSLWNILWGNSALPIALTLDSPNMCSTGFSIHELMDATQDKIWSFGIEKGPLTRCSTMDNGLHQPHHTI